MKALIYKDLCYLRDLYKQFILIFIVYTIVFLRTNPVTYIAINTAISFFFVINTFNYDRNGKWNSFALNMPLDKRDIVKSKYLLLFLTLSFIFLLSLIVYLFNSIILGNFIELEVIANAVLGILLTIPMYFLVIYLAFKYGADKIVSYFLKLTSFFLFFIIIGSSILGENKEFADYLNTLNNTELIIILLCFTLIAFLLFLKGSIRAIVKTEY